MNFQVDEQQGELVDIILDRTPFTYWGGKQKLYPLIKNCIPHHHTYVEPFTGGGAVFWLKANAPKSVLNDINNFVMNFYWVVKTKFDELNELIQASLHSRNMHKKATKIYKNPANYSRVELAWAFWYLTNFSIMQRINGGSMITERREGRVGLSMHIRKEQFTADISRKLKTTTLENKDALDIIDLYDWEEAFFFVDPPYIGTECGHYSGYTPDDFQRLLDKLNMIKGKFLLTCYPNDVLMPTIEKYNWHKHIITMRKDSGTFASGTTVDKQEVLTGNYAFDPYQNLYANREFSF